MLYKDYISDEQLNEFLKHLAKGKIIVIAVKSKQKYSYIERRMIMNCMVVQAELVDDRELFKLARIDIDELWYTEDLDPEILDFLKSRITDNGKAIKIKAV